MGGYGNRRSGNRPGLDRHDFSTDREVLPNVDRPVDRVVPNGRVVSAVHDIDLNLDCSRERRIALVLSHSLQLVRLSLCTHDGNNGTHTMRVRVSSGLLWIRGGYMGVRGNHDVVAR